MVGLRIAVVLGAALEGVVALLTRLSFNDLEAFSQGNVSRLILSLGPTTANLESLDRVRQRGRSELHHIWYEGCRQWEPAMLQKVKAFVQGDASREHFFLPVACIQRLDASHHLDDDSREGLIRKHLHSPCKVTTLARDYARLDELDPHGSWLSAPFPVPWSKLMSHLTEALLDGPILRLGLRQLWDQRDHFRTRRAIIKSFGRYAARNGGNRARLSHGLYGLYHVLVHEERSQACRSHRSKEIDKQLATIVKATRDTLLSDELLLRIVGLLQIKPFGKSSIPTDLHAMLKPTDPTHLCSLVCSMVLHFYPQKAREDALDTIAQLSSAWSDADIWEMLQNILVLHNLSSCLSLLKPALRKRLLAIPESWPLVWHTSEALPFFGRWRARFPVELPSPLSTAETRRELMTALEKADLSELQPRTLLGGRPTEDVLRELLGYIATQETTLKFGEKYLTLKNSKVRTLQSIDIVAVKAVLLLKIYHTPYLELHPVLADHLSSHRSPLGEFLFQIGL